MKKQIYQSFIAVAVFLLLVSFYFIPVFKGKVLVQDDVLQAEATQSEIMQYKEQLGDTPLWTNAMFAGMPSYFVWVPYSKSINSYIVWLLKRFMPTPIPTVFLYFLSVFVLMRVLRVRTVVAFVAGLAFAFFSYHFLIIAAGHSNKALAISFFAFVLASVVLLFREKWLYGITLGCLAWGLELRANHLQMTYYLSLVVGIWVLFEGIKLLRAKKRQTVLKLIGATLFCILFGVALNAAMIWSNYEYSKLSTRGEKILDTETTGSASGLDKDYAFEWSYGIDESMTFFVPNAFGGSSYQEYAIDSHVAKAMVDNGVQDVVQYLYQIPSYWGDQAFVAGPIYFGIVVLFLFFFLLRQSKIPYKKPLLTVIVLSLLLAWGNNINWLANLAYEYFPLYNKFRAVSSILTITGLCVAIFTFHSLDEVISRLKKDKQKLIRSLKITSIVFGGLLLLFAVVPDLFFSFTNPQEWEQYKDYTWFLTALKEDRIALFRWDVLRALVLVAFTALLILMYIKKSGFKTQWLFVAIGLLVLVDMWEVNRRYLNDNNYTEKSRLNDVFDQRDVDDIILNDEDIHYRVLDLSVNSFTNALPSVFHKNIGGYHAAKLRLYQDLIDVHFTTGLPEDVLNMLNMKYLIYNDTTNYSHSIRPNAEACGNAWFVNDIRFVKKPRDEINFLHSFNPRTETVLLEKFKTEIETKAVGYDPNSYIKLNSYHPDTLRYTYDSKTPAFAVFSEIYYNKGWNLYVDNKPLNYYRCNYLLRGAILPAGFHQVEFIFEPDSYYVGENISLASSVILLLLIGYSVVRLSRKKTE